MDEMSAHYFSKQPTTTSSSGDGNDGIKMLDFSKCNFGGNDNVYTVTCVSPVIDKDDSKSEFKVEAIDEKSPLDKKQLLVKELKIMYRNSL